MRTSNHLNGERQPLLAPALIRPVPSATRSPPDGGVEAWLTVLAGFFIFVNSW